MRVLDLISMQYLLMAATGNRGLVSPFFPAYRVNSLVCALSWYVSYTDPRRQATQILERRRSSSQRADSYPPSHSKETEHGNSHW